MEIMTSAATWNATQHCVGKSWEKSRRHPPELTLPAVSAPLADTWSLDSHKSTQLTHSHLTPHLDFVQDYPDTDNTASRHT